MSSNMAFKHPDSCAMFYQCNNTKPHTNLRVYENECGAGFLFDERDAICKPADQVRCGDRVIPSGTCGYRKLCKLPECQGAPNGYYALKDAPFTSEYYECITGQFVAIRKCTGAGEIFDPINKNCSIGIVPTSAQSYCSQNPQAKFPDPASCALFYDCSRYEHDTNLYAYQTECVYLYLYDVDLKRCVYFLQAKCQSRPEPRAPCEYERGHCYGRNHDQCISCDANCVTLPDGLNVYPGRSLTPYYLLCAAGRTINVKVCPDSQVFDPIVGGCVAQIATETMRLFCEANPGTIISHPGECAMYYDCKQTSTIGNFQIYERECKYPNLFDTTSLACVDFFNVTCEKRREPISPCDYLQYQCTDKSCVPCNQVLPDCTGREDGYYTVPRWELTSSYIVCQNFRFMFRYDCPPGQIFDILTKRCATTISQASMDAYCTKYPAGRIGNPLHCAQYSDCTAPMSSRLVECPYPQLFSYEYMECRPFTEVDCGRRIDFKNPCDYRRFYRCSSPDPSQCPPCESLYPSCHLQPEGFVAALPGTGNQYYICNRGRAILKTCRTTFSNELKRCLDPVTIPPVTKPPPPAIEPYRATAIKQPLSNIFTQDPKGQIQPSLQQPTQYNQQPYQQQPSNQPQQPLGMTQLQTSNQPQPQNQPQQPNLPYQPQQPSGMTQSQPPNQPQQPQQPSLPYQPQQPSGMTQPQPSNQPQQPSLPYQPQQPSGMTQTQPSNQPQQPSLPYQPQQPSGMTQPQPPNQPQPSGMTQPQTSNQPQKPSGMTQSQPSNQPQQPSQPYQPQQPAAPLQPQPYQPQRPLPTVQQQQTPSPVQSPQPPSGISQPQQPAAQPQQPVAQPQQPVGQSSTQSSRLPLNIGTTKITTYSTLPPNSFSQSPGQTNPPSSSIFDGAPVFQIQTRPQPPIVVTTTPIPTTPALPRPGQAGFDVNVYCAANRYDIFPHPNSCAKYYNCMVPSSIYEPYVSECPYPQLYDFTSRTCKYYVDVRCVPGVLEPVAPCEYDKYMAECNNTNCPPCEVNNPSCKGLSDGTHPYPGDAMSPRYTVCHTGRTIRVISCQPETFYDPVTKRCNHELTKESIDKFCMLYPNTVHQHPFNCAQFLKCTAQGSLVIECGYPRLFNGTDCDDFKKVDCKQRYKPVAPCEYAQNRRCPPGKTSCEPCEQRIPSCVGMSNDKQAYPGRPPSQLFVLCDSGRTSAVMQCQKNIFNPTTKQCSGTISIASVASICMRHPTAKFPDPENCARYFNCSMKEILLDRPFHGECKYPDFFSTLSNKCESFLQTTQTGGCGTRYTPVEPCEYHEHCPTQPNCDQCKRNLPSCNRPSLNDPGVNLVPNNTVQFASEWYFCYDNRTIAYGVCARGQYYNKAAGDCAALPSRTTLG
ncbi:uncharacterized protein LOC126826099 [Patella vulgata]|uniref:uncharacterized protein LOC126826099 n=1 Tax=Patella vulgata TaxID=6465 RepID=UPI00217FB086|nr:uncharacterized protein LOC126826099 [Patella vulgata]